MYYPKLLLVCLLVSCTAKSNLQFNFAKHIGQKDCIVISCLKCNCILDELNRIHKKDSALLARYDIFADSDCVIQLLPTIKIIPIEQKTLDSISTEFYNMVIIRHRSDNNFSATMIETKDAENIEKYLKQ